MSMLKRARVAVLAALLASGVPLAGAQSPAWQVLQRDAMTSYQQGDFEASRRKALEALDLAEKEGGRDSPPVFASLQVLGPALLSLGRLDEAEVVLKRSVVLVERAAGPDSPLLAQPLVHLAGVKMQRGQAAEAVPLTAGPGPDRAGRRGHVAADGRGAGCAVERPGAAGAA